jgi:hypothetical protein
MFSNSNFLIEVVEHLRATFFQGLRLGAEVK